MREGAGRTGPASAGRTPALSAQRDVDARGPPSQLRRKPARAWPKRLPPARPSPTGDPACPT
ncbi:hypothetical protein VP06_18255 [Methylobacterium aquaticum]|uniref:Uncharacterized protein n=1 Tax=Methylobacterium aquaticum TaxID=270351 RepID=A0A0J6SEJ5_9HYPH|nr:hypothetical protein VP06_18255 [Methylobacterium aquaticum]